MAFHLGLSGVGQKGREDSADEPGWDEQHHKDGRAKHHQGGAEPGEGLKSSLSFFLQNIITVFLFHSLKSSLFLSFFSTCACAWVCSDESSPGLG